jgi:tetratricopeptide (TPR) repeat protein
MPRSGYDRGMKHLVSRVLVLAAVLTFTGAAVAQQDRSTRPETPARPAEPPAKSTPDGKSPQARPVEPREPGKGVTPQSKAAPAKKKEMPGIAVTQPRTPAEREKALADLYAHLATAADEAAAKTVAQSIERLWLNAGSDTVGLLMERANQALQSKKPDQALRFLDRVTVLAPDFAEGWNRRAYVHFTANNIQAALGDIRRVLALDANHFKALDGLAHILKEIGQKKAALAAVRKLLEVHPFFEGAKAMHDELAREVEGQAL